MDRNLYYKRQCTYIKLKSKTFLLRIDMWHEVCELSARINRVKYKRETEDVLIGYMWQAFGHASYKDRQSRGSY